MGLTIDESEILLQKKLLTCRGYIVTAYQITFLTSQWLKDTKRKSKDEKNKILDEAYKYYRLS